MCLTLALYIIVKTELGLKILCLILLNLKDKTIILKLIVKMEDLLKLENTLHNLLLQISNQGCQFNSQSYCIF